LLQSSKQIFIFSGVALPLIFFRPFFSSAFGSRFILFLEVVFCPVVFGFGSAFFSSVRFVLGFYFWFCGGGFGLVLWFACSLQTLNW